MTTSTGLFSQSSLIKRMLIGAAIGLAVISLFIFPAKGGNPEWGRFWMIKPLLVTPFSGSKFIRSVHNDTFVDRQETALGW